MTLRYTGMNFLVNRPAMNHPIPKLQELRAACSNCSLRELCLPIGLSIEDLNALDNLVSVRKRVKRGGFLFRDGDDFQALYAIRTGFMKSTVITEDGRDQVTGFHMLGEIVGLDGIGSSKHSCDMVALEDSDVCVIHYENLEDFTQRLPQLQLNLHKIMSREIVREHGVMLLLGSRDADERLAAFLVNLSQRLKLRGYSPTEFVLRMTRAEIGSYLGLTFETVSRLLSRFQADGVIEVNQKNIRIQNLEALKDLTRRASCN